MAEYIEKESLLLCIDEKISYLRSQAGKDATLNYAIDLVQITRNVIDKLPTIDVEKEEG